jgi:curli biogenesis system outer membrane secretion channel CsgG
MSFALGDDARNQARTFLGIQSDIGHDLSDRFTSKLVGSGKVTVVERAALDKYITPEMLASNSSGFDTATSAKFGKLVGADTIILGTVTELTGSNNPTGMGRFGSIATGGNIDQRKVTIAVAVTVKVVDTNTAVILTQVEGRGSAVQQKSIVKGKNPNGSVYESMGTDFGNSLLYEAINKAFDSVMTQLNATTALSPIAAPPPPPRAGYSGMVADVSGSTLILTVGSKDGARVGDVVAITRVSRTIYDPQDKKKVLKVISDTIGTAKISELDEGTATATFTGTGTPGLKDKAVFRP